MACATGRDEYTVACAPYARTLWTYCHLLQREKLDEFARRADALNRAELMAIAFHDPKQLRDERRALQRDAGMFDAPEDARANALALVAEIEQVDRAGAWA